MSQAARVPARPGGRVEPEAGGRGKIGPHPSAQSVEIGISAKGTSAKRTLMIHAMRTGAGLNDREHYMARAARVKREQHTVWWELKASRVMLPELPVRVTLTRVSPSVRGLDDDNLRGSLKAVRDAVAHWLLVDDADERVQWCYAQRNGAWGVQLDFEEVA